MEQTQTKTDRTGWPAGPWDSEPDRLDFVHAGFACLVRRGPMGAWCGYVGVPEQHPAFGKDYDDEVVDQIQVHGGLTYAAACHGEICHVPQPGMPDNVWWLGFDCWHCDDIVPGMLALGASHGRRLWPFPMGIYRNLAYVKHQTEQLAEQLTATSLGA